MSYTNYHAGHVVHVICKSDPQGNYDKYANKIKRHILRTGYKVETTLDHLVGMLILSFDSDEIYDEEIFGDHFTLNGLWQYVEASGGIGEFDYYA